MADAASGKDRCSVTEEARREGVRAEDTSTVNYPRGISFFSFSSCFALFLEWRTIFWLSNSLRLVTVRGESSTENISFPTREVA